MEKKMKINWKKIKLTKEEQWIEDHAEEFKPVSRQEFEAVKQALEARKKDAILHIRINAGDLNALKHKAKKIGIKYQTFVAEILKRAAHS